MKRREFITLFGGASPQQALRTRSNLQKVVVSEYWRQYRQR